MGTVRTRKRGKTFSYVFEAGKQNGRRHVIEKGGFPSKEAAYNAGVAAYNDWQHGNIGITSDRVSLQDFMRNWLTQVIQPTVRTSTLALYTRVLETKIVPSIGAYSVQQLSPLILDGFMRSLLREGLAKNTIHNIWRLLHHALEYAVYPAQLIQTNPSERIHVPKSALVQVVHRTIITPEQFDRILHQNPYGSDYHIPLRLLYDTGMRVSEVLGLCWDSVDLAHRIIRVQRQLYYAGKGNLLFLPPKTETSKRDIRISEKLAAVLHDWHEHQKTMERQRGDSYCVVLENTDRRVSVCSKALAPKNGKRCYLVCTRSNGKLISRSALHARLQSMGLNAHSFRHTHATLLIEAGAPLKGVAGRLGHKHIDLTTNIYTHNTEKMQAMTEDYFEKLTQNRADKHEDADKLQTNENR